MTVNAGRVRSRLQALPIDNFPVIATPTGGNCFTLSAEYARDFAALVPAISKEETRYYLNGICVEASDGRIHMTATDGKTLAMIDRAAPEGSDGLASSIIPRKAIAAVMAATGKAPAPLSVNITAKKVKFDLEGMTITSKLIDGKFPDWRRAIELSIGDNPLEPCAIPFMNDRLALDVIARLEKASGVTLSVDIGEKAALLSSADYPEFCAVSYCLDQSATAKGFTRHRDQQEELRAIEYLTELAQRAGLSVHMLDYDGTQAVRTHWASGESQPRMIGVTFGKIVEHSKTEREPREVICYETFTAKLEYVYTKTPEIWQDGAYSVAMPREAVFDHRQATVAVKNDDGTYSDAQWLAQNNRGAISLSADHVAMLCGQVDPASFVHIPDVVFHRGEAVSVDGVATAAMPDGWTVNIAPTGKEAKALRERMVELARKNTPEAARELREIAAQFDAIRPMRDYEMQPAPIAVDAITPSAECEAEPTWICSKSGHDSHIAQSQPQPQNCWKCDSISFMVPTHKIKADLSPATAPESEAAVSQGEPLESIHSPASVAELVAVEPVAPSSAELEDWKAYMAARFDILEAKVDAVIAAATPPKPIALGDRVRLIQPGYEGEMATVIPYSEVNRYASRSALLFVTDSSRHLSVAIDGEGTQWERLDALTPLSPLNAAPHIGAKERTPAHVRAIMAYLKSRKVRNELDKIMRALNKASDHRATLRKSRDDWEGLQQRTQAKRRRAVLAARELQTRLYAEHRLVDRMQDRLRTAKQDAATWQALAEAEALRTRTAETALAAVQARANGWPPAVRSVNVQFGNAA